MDKLKEYMSELTPERIDELNKKRIESNKKLTLESQLGYYVGEYIVHRFLPTLSTDPIQSNNVIEVDQDDTIEHKRLEDELFDRHNPNSDYVDSEKWSAYLTHSKMLDLKYRPHKLVCHVTPLNVENMKEFKKGLISSLWDCDMCSYDLNSDNIHISNDEDGYFTVIEFQLKID